MGHYLSPIIVRAVSRFVGNQEEINSQIISM